jgi:recombination protein RecT
MTSVSNVVAQRDNGPRALVQQYHNDFATVLPSHIKPETWVRIAQGALKKGKKTGDRYELEIAAANNPGAFLAALLEAARLGLEPGTEQFYLTPRKVKGQLEILGITGYQGHIELMYRAGAVSSVVAEVVREHDDYQYDRGVNDVPIHKYPKFAGAKTRGKLIGVYAYARMTTGAFSRVVELGQEDIDEIKKSAQGANSEYSPWQTHPESMWLKSAVRQLQKWVPTSSEYIREQLRAVADVTAEHAAKQQQFDPWTPPDNDAADVIDAQVIDTNTGELFPTTDTPETRP